MFAPIDSGLWAMFRQAAWSIDATPRGDAETFQPSFIRDSAASLSYLGNMDGFALRTALFADVGVKGSITITVDAAYKMDMADGVISPTNIQVTGGYTATGLAGSVGLGDKNPYPQVANALKFDLPGQINEAVKARAATTATGPLAPFRCRPTVCGGSPQVENAACRVQLSRFLADNLSRAKGYSAMKALSIVSALKENQFFCEADSSMFGEENDSLKGVCKFRPQFKRAVVTPTGVEMVMYEHGEAPTADYEIATLSADSPVKCLSTAAPKGVSLLPKAEFSHALEPVPEICGTKVRSCEMCGNLAAAGCPMPPSCREIYHVGDGGFCGVCDDKKPGRGMACHPELGINCQLGLGCFLVGLPGSTPGTWTSERRVCLPTGTVLGDASCFNDPDTPAKYTCVCRLSATGSTCL